MSGAHTPGPWAPHPVNRWVSPAADMEMPVCLLRHESHGIPADEEEVRANARLIAAAPEMFEALCEAGQALWEALEAAGVGQPGNNRVYNLIRAAAAKADQPA